MGKRLPRASAYNRGITLKRGERISMVESRPETERELSEQDARWHVVYVAVIVFAVLVISALYFFSRYFSS
ncbi:MAG TPA: hypothetical protein VD835_06185 [Pyrinomonadaceae bacterium]|nr:hypothetical protein [Pyrinomonadaceae bacterium]